MRRITVANKWTQRVASFDYEEKELSAQREGELVHEKLLRACIDLGCTIGDLLFIQSN